MCHLWKHTYTMSGNFKACCAFLRTNFTVNSLGFFFLYDYVCIKSEKNLFIKKNGGNAFCRTLADLHEKHFVSPAAIRLY